MPVPKKRKSKSRQRTRRAHNALKVPSLGRCARCSQPVMPHQVCGNCGYYGKRKLIEVKEK